MTYRHWNQTAGSGKRGRKYHFARADSMAEACAEADARPPKDGSSNFRYKSCRTWDETRRRLEQGIPTDITLDAYAKEGAEARDGFEQAFRAVAPSAKRRRAYSDHGARLDMGRLMGGDPDHWVSRKRDAKRRVIRLGINVTVSCGDGESAFARIAAFSAAACDALEAQGYGCEIVAFMSTLKRSMYWIRIKAADEPLDVMQILSLGCTGLLRHVFFTMDDDEGRPCGESRGSIERPDEYQRNIAEIDYVIGREWLGGDQIREYAEGFASDLFGDTVKLGEHA